MAWAWIENGNIFVAYSEDVVPKGVAVIEVPDNATPSDLAIDETGQLRLKTEQEKLADLKQEKLQQLKSYVSSLLSQTDWVIIKLQSIREEKWPDTEIQVEMQKYQPILDRRKAIREWNLQMKQVIQNATTIEELEVIRIEFPFE